MSMFAVRLSFSLPQQLTRMRVLQRIVHFGPQAFIMIEHWH